MSLPSVERAGYIKKFLVTCLILQLQVLCESMVNPFSQTTKPTFSSISCWKLSENEKIHSNYLKVFSSLKVYHNITYHPFLIMPFFQKKSFLLFSKSAPIFLHSIQCQTHPWCQRYFRNGPSFRRKIQVQNSPCHSGFLRHYTLDPSLLPETLFSRLPRQPSSSSFSLLHLAFVHSSVSLVGSM